MNSPTIPPITAPLPQQPPNLPPLPPPPPRTNSPKTSNSLASLGCTPPTPTRCARGGRGWLHSALLRLRFDPEPALRGGFRPQNGPFGPFFGLPRPHSAPPGPHWPLRRPHSAPPGPRWPPQPARGAPLAPRAAYRPPARSLRASARRARDRSRKVSTFYVTIRESFYVLRNNPRKFLRST